MNHTDDQLLNLYIKSGETEYFGELYNRYIPLIYGVCLKFFQDTDLAEDVVMRIFEDLSTRISQYDEIKEFKDWIYNITKDYCFDILKKENIRETFNYTNEAIEYEEIIRLLCDEKQDEEKAKILNYYLERLPESQRISILHFFADKMSYEDIVEKTGFPLTSVKNYIQKGKQNLKVSISNHLK